MPEYRVLPAAVKIDETTFNAIITGQQVWFIDDDSALLVRDPQADPVVISEGGWLQIDATGTVIESR